MERKIIKFLNINVNRDELFDEINEFNELFKHLQKEEKSLDNVKNWSKLLSSIDLPNLLIIVETVMAIPIGNDFVERVFITMKKV